MEGPGSDSLALSLRYQYQVLVRNPVITENNRHLLVETFRCIAEILIWGDQNDSRVFEYVHLLPEIICIRVLTSALLLPPSPLSSLPPPPLC